MSMQELAFQSLFNVVFVCVRIVFYIFVFKILLKLNKYLDRQLKHDCTFCEYKQQYSKDQLSNLPLNNDNDNS